MASPTLRPGGDRSYVVTPGDADFEGYLIEEWMQAGAPDSMTMWQTLAAQRQPSRVPQPSASEWMTVAEVAQTFRWAAKTVRADVRAGRLTASGGENRSSYRIRRADAEAWADSRRRRRATAKPSRRHPEPKPSGSTFRDLVGRSA